MATVTTTAPSRWQRELAAMRAARPAFQRRGTHKMEILNEIGNRAVIPFAPQNINYGEYGIEWAEVDRFGTYATFRDTGLKVPTVSFDLTIAESGHNGHKEILRFLEAFDRMARRESRITINYTIREVGVWILTSYSHTVTHRDVYQRPTRADVSLTFSRIMDEKAFLGPIKGRSASLKPAPKPAAKKKTNTATNLATYKVKKGDTLWDLAKKYYSNPSLWPKIADRNGVKNPRLLQIGTKLVIPKV